jgi:hypothetical protein
MSAVFSEIETRQPPAAAGHQPAWRHQTTYLDVIVHERLMNHLDLLWSILFRDRDVAAWR